MGGCTHRARRARSPVSACLLLVIPTVEVVANSYVRLLGAFANSATQLNSTQPKPFRPVHLLSKRCSHLKTQSNPARHEDLRSAPNARFFYHLLDAEHKRQELEYTFHIKNPPTKASSTFLEPPPNKQKKGERSICPRSTVPVECLIVSLSLTQTLPSQSHPGYGSSGWLPYHPTSPRSRRMSFSCRRESTRWPHVRYGSI